MSESTTRNKYAAQNVTQNVPGRAETKAAKRSHATRKPPAKELGGANGPEPTRYGDWERNGRCTDF